MTKSKNSQVKLTDEEHNAFEEHCRASETYKYLKIDTKARREKWLLDMQPTGEMALEDFDRWAGMHMEGFIDDRDRYKIIKVKGYDNGKSSEDDCYPCATQRHKCEHDGQDDSEDYPEWWNEV
tara:strand:- start:843 stop:1211 length:369 start_codon:yes stop_codon:yes gene_type:complete